MRNVSLDEIISELNQEYDISGIKAVYPADNDTDELDINSQKREQIEDIGQFNGFGLELGDSTSYIEHPLHHGKGLGETGPSHQHVKHYIHGRADVEAGLSEQEVEEIVRLTSHTLEIIEEKEDERRTEIWSEWADENNYHDQGRLKKWWMRKFRAPNDGNHYLNPAAVIDDLERQGLSENQLFETLEVL